MTLRFKLSSLHIGSLRVPLPAVVVEVELATG